MNPAQDPKTDRNQLGIRLGQASLNTYGEPLSQAIGDRWPDDGCAKLTPHTPTDAERFALELERISARLLDLNTLLNASLGIYTKKSVCSEGDKVDVIGRVYNSSYFNNLGNLTDSMRLNINLIEHLIDDLEI